MFVVLLDIYCPRGMSQSCSKLVVHATVTPSSASPCNHCESSDILEFNVILHCHKCWAVSHVFIFSYQTGSCKEQIGGLDIKGEDWCV